MFYEEHKDTEEIKEKRKRNAQRSREVAERLLQLKQQGLLTHLSLIFFSPTDLLPLHYAAMLPL